MPLVPCSWRRRCRSSAPHSSCLSPMPDTTQHRVALHPTAPPCFPQVWQDALRSKAQSPYMSHTLANGVLNGFRFCPYEDVLGIGHSEGFSTILIPGACCSTRLD